MVIVDSSVWIDFIGNRPSEHTVWLKQQMSRTTLGLTDLILMEVLQGFREDKVFEHVSKELTRWCQVFDTGGSRSAVAAAGNYRQLRSLGVTVRKPIDCLIATFCISQEHALLHRDRDFDAFEQHLGLKVIHPVQH